MPSVQEDIKAIVSAIQTTSITIGELKGHFVTDEQLQELLFKFFLQDNSPATNLDTEVVVRARRAEIARELKSKNAQLVNAAPADRTAVNHQIGKLLSERAKLDKVIARIQDL